MYFVNKQKRWEDINKQIRILFLFLENKINLPFVGGIWKWSSFMEYQIRKIKKLNFTQIPFIIFYKTMYYKNHNPN